MVTFWTHADKSCFTLCVVHNIPTDRKPEKKLNKHYVQIGKDIISLI